MGPSRDKRTHFRVEQLEGRWTPSAVAGTPANGEEFGRFNRVLVESGTNIGLEFCKLEQGNCAGDVLSGTDPDFPSLGISPPGNYPPPL
jgi:hypothetical protein